MNICRFLSACSRWFHRRSSSRCFLGIISDRSVEDKKIAARIGALGFFVTTSIFVFAGESILSIFGIEISAFQVAGGFLLLLIALDMMRSAPSDTDGSKDGHGSIVALGLCR